MPALSRAAKTQSVIAGSYVRVTQSCDSEPFLTT